MIRSVRNAAIVLLATAGLAGCELPGIVSKDAVILPCPDFHILADAAVLAKFRQGPGRDLTDVDHLAKIENGRVSCESDLDEETLAGTMDVDVEVFFAVERGPANRTRSAELPYFISVTDQRKNVLYRETFRVVVEFPGNQTRVAVASQPVILEVPIRPKGSGRDYLVYIGMQLTEEQLRFNRERANVLVR